MISSKSLDRSGDIHSLQQLKARYFLYLDTKDWPKWRELFATDARLVVDLGVADAPMESERVEGGDAVAAFVEERLRTAQTVHHGHTPLFDFVSDTEATGIWAMADIVDYGDSVLRGYGHYREKYRKEDGIWRFTEVHLTRLRVEISPKER